MPDEKILESFKLIGGVPVPAAAVELVQARFDAALRALIRYESSGVFSFRFFVARDRVACAEAGVSLITPSDDISVDLSVQLTSGVERTYFTRISADGRVVADWGFVQQRLR